MSCTGHSKLLPELLEKIYQELTDKQLYFPFEPGIQYLSPEYSGTVFMLTTKDYEDYIVNNPGA